jgi:uncharacterized protein (TIGR00369 family)
VDNLDQHRAAASRFRTQLGHDSKATQKMQPVSNTSGTEILSVDADGAMDLRFTLDRQFGNFFGGVHGGIISALVDEACSYAAVAAVGVHCFLGTAELHARIFGKAKVGVIDAKAKISQRSRYAVHADVELFSEERKIAAGNAVLLIDLTRPINENWVVEPRRGE